MAKFTDAVRATLTSYFNAGDQPTEAQFTALILAIQEGIEEHQHDSTGDGDGTGILNGPITMADGTWIGIGAALERITFDAAGDITIGGANFGVNLGTPLKRAHIRESAIAGGFTVDGNVRTVMVLEEGVSGARLCLASPSDGSSAVDFSDEDDWNVGEILYNHADDYMTFRVNDVEQFRIESNGRSGFGLLGGAATGKVHIDQPTSDAAIPTLVLDQADTSEGFINFLGSDRGVIGEGTNSVESVRVEVNGVVRRIAVYADA